MTGIDLWQVWNKQQQVDVTCATSGRSRSDCELTAGRASTATFALPKTARIARETAEGIEKYIVNRGQATEED
jgi:hypothetical protein